MSLKNIYEIAVASRPATRQLLNEITNSNRNVEEFQRVYTPWFPFGETRIQGWKWNWPAGELIDKVSEYQKLFTEKKYPSPTRINSQDGVIPYRSRASFDRVMQWSLDNQVEYTARQYYEDYKMFLRNLLEQSIEQKNGWDILHIAVERLLNEGGVWTIEVIDAGSTSTREVYKARFALNTYVIHFIILYFAKFQRILPQRDIFKYGSVYNLLQTLASAVSNRQKKSTKKAQVQGQDIPGKIYEDNNLLIVEPRSWEFSRRYFGAPTRRSLLTNRLFRGATWCTAASTREHWEDYIDTQYNHLYYLVEKTPEERLFAIRTVGGADVIDDMNSTLETKYNEIYQNSFLRPFHYQSVLPHMISAGVISQVDAVRKVYNDFLRVIQSARDERGFIREINGQDVKKIITIAKDLKEKNPMAYIEAFTFEVRDQENNPISYGKLFKELNINLNFVFQHLDFFDALDFNTVDPARRGYVASF